MNLLYTLFYIKVNRYTYYYASALALASGAPTTARRLKNMCLRPKPATFTKYTKLDEKTGEIYDTRKIHFVNYWNYEPEDQLKDQIQMIPCGSCSECLISKSKDWAARAYLESQKWPVNAFLTLTYNNDNLPKKRTLVKADLQKFWKRLRKKGYKIRYMACGEYGPTTLRPHYHAAVFNYWPEDAKFYKMNHTNEPLFTSEQLNQIWGKGYVIVGRLTYESAAYIARYVYKKAFGLNKEWNTKNGRLPEFTLASRKGGIGINAFENKNIWNEIKRNFGILIPTKTGVKKMGIPQYLRQKWRTLDNREEYFKLADKQTHAKKDDTRAILSKTDKNIVEYNKQSSAIKAGKLKRLDKRQEY